MISLSLVFAMALSFASCDGDDDVTSDSAGTSTQSSQTDSTQTTVDQTEKATENAQTNTPDATEPAEDTTKAPNNCTNRRSYSGLFRIWQIWF